MQKRNKLENGQSGFTSDYVRYVRPGLGKLLRGLRLDLEYVSGSGDKLETHIDGELRTILDMTGGYGANLVGHRNPQLMRRAQKEIEVGAPSNVQGSLRRSSVELAKQFDARLYGETEIPGWVSHFSNTGTEAVEAAIKHSFYFFSSRLIKLQQELTTQKNRLLVLLKSSKKELAGREEELRVIFSTMLQGRLRSHSAQQSVARMTLMELVDQYYTKVLGDLVGLSPKVGTINGGFHGKTLGALEAMGAGIHLEGLGSFQRRMLLSADPDLLRSQVEETVEAIKYFDATTMQIKEIKFSYLSCILIEPVQGEGGIKVQSNELVQMIRNECSKYSIQMISDEVQSGLYRTGTFASLSHYGIAADIYVFSKGLGGGLAKIGVTTINLHQYSSDFSIKHTSTFSEDHFSSSIALEVLSILTEQQVEQGMAMAELLIDGLCNLKEQYPEIVREVRGKGLMIGLELNFKAFENLSLEARLFSEQGMLGHYLASVLLHKEGLRVAPSLSNIGTLRLEPSVFLSESVVSEVLSIFQNFFECAQKQKHEYFFVGSGLQENEVENQGDSLSVLSELNQTEGLDGVDAVFLCHFIDAEHCRRVLNQVNLRASQDVAQAIYDFSLVQSYLPICRGELHGKNGRHVRYALVSIACTSQEFVTAMTRGEKDRFIFKIQNVIDVAKESGAKAVGLGQFNSIITNNGLALDSHGMSLTTGNAYTVHLAHEAVKAKISERGWKPEEINLCSIGAAGNIMAMVTKLVAGQCNTITLVNRTPIQHSQAFRRTVIEVLEGLKDSRLVRDKDLRNFLNTMGTIADSKVVDILKHPLVSERVKIGNGLDACRGANLVICGTSAHRPILGREHIDEGTLIVDVSVPSNIKDEVYEIHGVEVIAGGLAKLPDYNGEKQFIDTPVFPLGKGECFACMAETFAMALSGTEGELHIGDVTSQMVDRVGHLASDAGIELGRIKDSGPTSNTEKSIFQKAG